jgi:hypothetical protein
MRFGARSLKDRATFARHAALLLLTWGRGAVQSVDVGVDAATQAFVIWHQPFKRVAIKGLQKAALSFDRFVELMSQQALSEQRQSAQAHRRVE